MTHHIANIKSLQTFNEARLYLHIELAKHPIDAYEKNRLAAALAYLQMTGSLDKLKSNAANIITDTHFCDVVKLANSTR